MLSTFLWKDGAGGYVTTSLLSKRMVPIAYRRRVRGHAGSSAVVGPRRRSCSVTLVKV